MIYRLARRLLPAGPAGMLVGLLSALFLALSRYHITYSQEARSYSLMFLLVLISCHEMAILLGRSNPRAQLAYVLSGGAMLWVQPFSVFVLVAQTLFLGSVFLYRRLPHQVGQKTSDGIDLRRWVLLQSAAVVLFGPWLGWRARRTGSFRDTRFMASYSRSCAVLRHEPRSGCRTAAVRGRNTRLGSPRRMNGFRSFLPPCIVRRSSLVP